MTGNPIDFYSSAWPAGQTWIVCIEPRANWGKSRHPSNSASEFRDCGLDDGGDRRGEHGQLGSCRSLGPVRRTEFVLLSSGELAAFSHRSFAPFIDVSR